MCLMMERGLKIHGSWWKRGMRRAMRPDGIILAPTVRRTGVPHLLLKGVWTAGATYLTKAAVC